MNKTKARLQVVETEPKFFKPRPVPYSLKLDIERELNRLVERKYCPQWNTAAGQHQ